MKPALGLVLGALVAIAIGSCWVDRRTSDFACDTDDDCVDYQPSRVCDTAIGYCVEGDNPNDCPASCTNGCDRASRTCVIDCPTPSSCSGQIVCPDGWSCTITCGANGCNAINCQGTAQCTINCAAPNACNSIDCGSDGGRCNINCSGPNACDDIDCNSASCQVACATGSCGNVNCDNACRCDVVCVEGTSCDNLDCPDLDCESPTGCSSTQVDCPTTCP